jgi:DNA-binding transcriptional LysR family regulator
MAVNHQHLRAFHAVAIEGSFSRAARRLNISQPTLSQQIKALETRHSTNLFEGRRPPLHLTPTGRELLSLTQRLFATSDQIGEILGDRPVDERLAIRMVSDSPIYAARLAQALLQSELRPGVEVQIDNSRDTLARLLDARADVAIISDPQIDPRFAYQPLFIDYLKVLLPADHELAGASVYPLSAFAGECLLMRELSSKTRAAIESLLRAHDIRPARVVELHSREALREAVAIGVGISLFFSSECPPDTRLVALEPECQPDSALLTGYVVYRVEQRRSAIIRLVLSAASSLELLSPIPLELLPSKRGSELRTG